MIIVKVEVTVNEGYDEINDGIGGLCDIIRDGLNHGNYQYIKDIVVLTEGAVHA